MVKHKISPKNLSDSLISFLPFLRKLRKTSRTLIEVEINSKAILHNAEAAAQFTGVKIAPVLKSNAYGHGLIEVAGILEKTNDDHHFPFFAVDSYFEALTLRQIGVKTKILVVGYSFTDTVKKSRMRDVAFIISSLDALQELINSKADATIHLKIDTGMHRQGIDTEDIKHALELIHESPGITLEGICSHLADAHNDADPDFTKKQINLWNQLVENVTREFPGIKYVHLTNTAGMAYHSQVKMNVARLGLGLYGFADRPELEKNLGLRPALRIKSVISQIKKIKAGESVGYNCAYKAPQDMYIAVVPAGYNEGIDRRLSGLNNSKDGKSDREGGCFLVNGQVCPIVGAVSMNMTTIDVTELVKKAMVKRDDKVVIVSDNLKDPNSIKAISARISAIPYENLIKIPDSLRRVVKS